MRNSCRRLPLDALSSNPEGQFFPDSYEIDAGNSDLQIYQTAYQTMQRRLNDAWEDRQSGLPYKNPYEMLIMASLIDLYQKQWYSSLPLQGRYQYKSEIRE